MYTRLCAGRGDLTSSTSRLDTFVPSSYTVSLYSLQVRWRQSGPSTHQPLLSCPTSLRWTVTTPLLSVICGGRTACMPTPGWTEHRRQLEVTLQFLCFVSHPAQIPQQPLLVWILNRDETFVWGSVWLLNLKSIILKSSNEPYLCFK